MKGLYRFFSIALFIFCSFALGAPASHAWGPKGHQWIADKAVECLEGDLKTFFAKHRNYIVEHSMDPDYRKDQDPAEGVRHFIDLDRYGRFPFRQFDLNYDNLVIKVGKETVDKNGTVLWSAQQTFENLVQAFKARDQQKILLYTTDLAHYVGDLHQPFHAVENYNGQLTGQHGIHFRFEDDLLNLYIDKIQFVPSRPRDLDAVLPALYGMAVDSFMWVDNILVADQKVVSALSIDRKNLPREGRKIVYPDRYFSLLFEEVDKIIERRLNQSAHALASLWWMAWQKAGKPSLSATITWAGGERLTLNKLLLINGQIVPHFGTGTLGNITITTQLVINNPNGEAINVTAQFFNPSGAPLNVRVGTTTATQHTFNIAAKSSRFVELDPSGVVPPQTGWVLMTTNAANPFQAAVLFSNENRIGSAITASLETPLVSGSRLRTEAGIAAAVLDTRHVLQVGNTNDGLSTAFAVANPTAKSANAALTFRSDDGQTTRQRSLTLPAKNQTAQFFTDFFNLSSGQALSGTLTIISDTDLAVMALRTLNGEQTASLPSGTSGP